jgi:hypothetical protein
MVVVRDGVSVFLAVMGVERGFGGVAEISPTERLDLEREREDLKLGEDQDSWRERMQRVEKGGVSRGITPVATGALSKPCERLARFRT